MPTDRNIKELPERYLCPDCDRRFNTVKDATRCHNAPVIDLGSPQEELSPALERYRQSIRDAEAGNYCVSCKRPFDAEQSEDRCAFSGELPPPGGLVCGGDKSQPEHNPHDPRFDHFYAPPLAEQANDDALPRCTHTDSDCYKLIEQKRKIRIALAAPRRDGESHDGRDRRTLAEIEAIIYDRK